MNKRKKVFIICPVREITEGEKRAIEIYVASLERSGFKVHLPFRDTNQNDPTGLEICSENRSAIKKADEIHVWWNGKSQGSFFDLGMAFGLRKKIVLVNHQNVQQTKGKSFENVLLQIKKNQAT